MALVKKGISGANFYAMINGQNGGYLESMTLPTLEAEKISLALGPDGVTKQALGRMKLGDIKVVVGVSEANAMWELIDAVMKKNCKEFEAVLGVADHNYKSIREVELSTCLIKEVAPDELTASDGKALFKVTVTFVAQEVKYSDGSGSVIKGNLSGKQKGWQKSYFDPIGVPGGIPAQSITKISLAKHTAKIVEEHLGMFRHPTKNYAAYGIEGLKTDISATGYEAARDLAIKIMHDGYVEESEFVDWSVNIKDPSHTRTVGEVAFIQTAPHKFTPNAETKGGEDKAMNSTLEWLIEGQIISLKQTA